jgi:hypothetical protein
MAGGIVPSKKFVVKFKSIRAFISPICSGISPERKLRAKRETRKNCEIVWLAKFDTNLTLPNALTEIENLKMIELGHLDRDSAFQVVLHYYS